MRVNRLALLAASFSCVSVSWATFPTLEAMLNSVPADTVVAPNDVPLVVAINALPEVWRVAAYQSLSPLADGSLTVASDGSMRQFIEAIDDRLRPIPPLCRDLCAGISSGDTVISQKQTNTSATQASPKPTVTARGVYRSQTAITADPPQSPLHTQLQKLDPKVQKILLESWAQQNAQDTEARTQKELDNVKKEADIAKKEADLAKKEAIMAKKEAEAAKQAASASKTSDSTDNNQKENGDKTNNNQDKSNANGNLTPEEEVQKLGLAGASDEVLPNPKKDEEEKYRCKGVWAQLLGSSIDQKHRDDILGYDAHVWGLIIGRDGELNEQARVGFAGGYQQARTYSDVYSGSFFDVKRYQLSMYGRYDFGCNFYNQWAITGAFNRYDSKHKLLVLPSYGITTISNIAHGIFTAWEADFYFETGYDYHWCNFQAIPKLFMTYRHFNPEGYFEKDALNLDLSVKYKDMDLLTFAGGFKFNYTAEFAKAFVVPEVHAYYFYNAVNDKQIAVATYVQATYPFYTQGSTPEQSHLEVGGALTLHSYKYMMIKLAYDAYWCSDYHRRQGYLQIRYHWA